jgi:hypothetical protein
MYVYLIARGVEQADEIGVRTETSSAATRGNNRVAQEVQAGCALGKRTEGSRPSVYKMDNVWLIEIQIGLELIAQIK